jgi:putative ABC transport system permease protein
MKTAALLWRKLASETVWWLLLLAVVVAITASGTVSSVVARTEAALTQQAGDLLAADLVAITPQPIEAQISQAWPLAQQSHVTQFPSMAVAADNLDNPENQVLVSAKAVDERYPLRGQLQIDRGRGLETVADRPKAGEVWVDDTLLTSLNLRLGQTLQLGTLRLRIAAVIILEPDRTLGVGAYAPRVMLTQQDLPRTGLLGVGSRAEYRWLLRGALPALEALQKQHPKWRWQSARQARPELSSALDRARQMLSVAALATGWLAAAALALAAHWLAQRFEREISVLRVLALSRRQLLAVLSATLLLTWLVGGLLALALSYGLQAALAAAVVRVLKLSLPAASLGPLLQAWAVGGATLLVFAGLPLWRLSQVPPMRALRQSAADVAVPLWQWTLGVLALLALLAWQNGWQTVLGLLLGLGAALVLLMAGAALFSRLPWFASIRQRGRLAWVQVAALGAVLTAVLLLTLVQSQLLNEWQQSLPKDAPNRFFLNLQSEQKPAFEAWFQAKKQAPPVLMPMLRARLVQINQKEVTPDTYDDPETQRWIAREFNLSWTANFGKDNKIQTGQGWDAAQDRSVIGKPWVSVESAAVKRLKLKVGDVIRLDFAGTALDLTVVNTRKVQWDSFKPNFFLVTPPGLLETLPQQWIGSFRSGADKALQAELLKTFPNLTVFNLDQTLAQVRQTVDRVGLALSGILLFALAAGVLVLFTVMEVNRAVRVREVALMRCFGASAQDIQRALWREYAALGALVGGLSALLAQGLVLILAWQWFEKVIWPSGLVLLITPLLTALFCAVLGAWRLQSVVHTSPKQVLQNG